MDSTINMVVNPSCYVFFLILACLGGIGSAQPDTASPSGTFQGRRCGYMNDCPGGQSCSYQLAISEPGCLGKGNCVAYCVDLPPVPDLPRPPPLPEAELLVVWGVYAQAKHLLESDVLYRQPVCSRGGQLRHGLRCAGHMCPTERGLQRASCGMLWGKEMLRAIEDVLLPSY